MGWAALEETLMNVLRSPGVWPPLPSEPPANDTADWVALAIRAFWVGEFEALQDAAAHARSAASGDLDRVLAAGAQGLAVAGVVDGLWSDPWSAHLPLPHHDQGDQRWAFARYLLAESALAAARVDIATSIAGTDAGWHQSWIEHPFSVVMLAARVRISTFAARIDEAAALLPALTELGRRHALQELVSAVASLVAGNADDVAATQAEIARLIADEVPVEGYVGRGVHLLAAFGAVALGEVDQAAALVLVAGGDVQLGKLTIVDRTLGLELLTAAAIASEDVDAAQAWCAQAELLAASPIAAPIIDRIRARVALLTGDAAAAVKWADRATAAARAHGRAVEAAESEMVLARARIAVDQVAQATRSLRETVSAADATGHRAVRRSATETLATVRRRLPPLRGSGWGALSPRETEVAELIVRGEDSAAIAQVLFLSPATVRVHTSRVLAAFGVPTRTALIAVVARTRPPAGGVAALPALTVRRAQVVELIAHGWTNARIAEVLGISVGIVERHTSEAMRAWHAKSRAQLAALWWTQNLETDTRGLA